MAGAGEIVDDDGVAEFGGLFAFGDGSVAGPDQETRGASGVPAGLQVDELVADDIAAGEVDAVVGGGVVEEGGGGFATAAGLIGCFGGDIEAVEGDILGGEFGFDVAMDAVNIGEGEVAATDAGLVGDDEEEEAGVLEGTEGGGGAGDEFDFLRGVKVMTFCDEGAVAVEEDGWEK